MVDYIIKNKIADGKTVRHFYFLPAGRSPRQREIVKRYQSPAGSFIFRGDYVLA